MARHCNSRPPLTWSTSPSVTNTSVKVPKRQSREWQCRTLHSTPSSAKRTHRYSRGRRRKVEARSYERHKMSQGHRYERSKKLQGLPVLQHPFHPPEIVTDPSSCDIVLGRCMSMWYRSQTIGDGISPTSLSALAESTSEMCGPKSRLWVPTSRCCDAKTAAVLTFHVSEAGHYSCGLAFKTKRAISPSCSI